MDLLIALPFACAAFAGAGAYLLTRRDLGQRRSALVAAVCAVAVGASFMFVLYLAVLAFIGAAATYLLLRRWVRLDQALAVSATALTGLLAVSALAVSSALDTM